MTTPLPEDHKQIVLFTLDEPRYALHLSTVERVVRAVEITPLPKAPEIVLGVINVQGQVMPVIDVRRRFCLPMCEMKLNDRFIVVRTSRRLVALVADSVAGVRAIENRDMVIAQQALPFAAYLQGVAKVNGDIVLIYDLDRFLSLDEEQALDAALSEARDEA
jgi:purine-binding chemotaxis protein CheW